MALMNCPDCGREVSASAQACPNCARPLAGGLDRCPHCGGGGVAKVRGLQGPLEVLIGLAGLLLFIVPGIVYYIVMESIPFCASCGHRVRRPS